MQGRKARVSIVALIVAAALQGIAVGVGIGTGDVVMVLSACGGALTCFVTAWIVVAWARG